MNPMENRGEDRLVGLEAGLGGTIGKIIEKAQRRNAKEYRDDLAEKLHEIRNIDSTNPKGDHSAAHVAARVYLAEKQETEEYLNTRQIHLHESNEAQIDALLNKYVLKDIIQYLETIKKMNPRFDAQYPDPHLFGRELLLFSKELGQKFSSLLEGEEKELIRDIGQAKIFDSWQALLNYLRRTGHGDLVG